MIEIEDLTLSFGSEPVVKNVSLTINDGEILGLVGESGSGKSVTALTLMGLENEKEKLLSGKIIFDEVVLRSAGIPKDKKLYRSLQGDDMAMVFQEPMTSLNPTMKVGLQIDENLKLHTAFDKKERKKRVLQALESVGLKDSERVYDAYPHELSGGMRQRVMIAMAVILRPKLLVCDEPTTALDVTVQKQITELLKSIRNEQKNSMLFITHDLKLAAMLCDRIAVMKDGRVVETGTPDEIFNSPKEEYTKILTSAARGKRKEKTDFSGAPAIIKAEDLSVYYRGKGNSLFKNKMTETVKHVTFDIRKGECVGLVGESGSGKTTVAKAVLGINRSIKGGLSVDTFMPQMIFQDPYSSLNPTKTIGWQLEEALRAKGGYKPEFKTDAAQRRRKAEDMLEAVGLKKEYYSRYPHELSGGQRQRVSIGQALIAEPEFIVADEPVSALDVTIQSQIMELLKKLQKEMGLTMLFISHDIAVVGEIADRIMVMKDGELKEFGDAGRILDDPADEYTKELMAAAIL